MHRDTQDSAGNRSDRITTISLAIVCQSFQSLTIGGIALFLPLIRKDLGLSFTQGGAISAATILAFALMQVPSGYLVDRFGPKRLFFIGVLFTTSFSLTFGLVTEYWQAIANQTLAGFFRAFLFIPGLALLTEWFPSHRQATAMALYLMGGLLGDVVLDILGPLLVIEFGWRFPFISIASVGIIVSFVFLRFGKEPPRTSEQQKVTIREVFQLLSHRIMWVCGILQYIRLAVVRGVAFWLPSLLIDEKGMSLPLTGLLIAVQACLTAPSSIVGGYVSDRLRNPALVIGFSLIILAVTTGLLVMINNIIVLIVIISINAIFLQMYFGPLFALPIETLGTHTAGLSRGFSNLFANIGSFTFVYLLGALKDITGSFELGFYTIAGICIIGLVFTFPLEQMRRKAMATTIKEPKNPDETAERIEATGIK